MNVVNPLMDRVMRGFVDLRMRRSADYPASNTALLVVAPHRDLLGRGLPNLLRLLEVARAASIPAMFAPMALTRPGQLPTPSQQELVDSGVLRPDTASADLHPTIDIGTADVVLAPFCGLSAFTSPGLGATVTTQRYEHLIIAGARTDIEVDSTARDATEAGLRTTVVADCCVGRSAAGHDAAVSTTLPRLVHGVLTLAELERFLGVEAGK